MTISRAYALLEVEGLASESALREAQVKVEKATIVKKPPPAIPGPDKPHHVIRFSGKPPKQLGVGDLYVMRNVDDDAVRFAVLASDTDVLR